MQQQVDNQAYYALLNVPREASTEQIKKSFRGLAQAFHPDKHSNDELQGVAQQSFQKLQEAYEVLSDPQRRQVYDLYGKEGLSAGMDLSEVSAYSKFEEFKQQFEKLKKDKENEQSEMKTQVKGIVSCKVDATNTIAKGLFPQRQRTAQFWAPDFYSFLVTQEIQQSFTESDFGSLGGQVVLKEGQGAGQIIGGYRKIISPQDQIQFQVVAGQKSSISVTSWRQISSIDTGNLSIMYRLNDGFQLSLDTTRQFSDKESATFAVVLAPAPLLSLLWQKRDENYDVAFRLEVGVISMCTVKVSYRLAEHLIGKIQFKLWYLGIDVDTGCAYHRGTPTHPSQFGLNIQYSTTSGVVLKPMFAKSNHIFYFPIIMTDNPQELKVIALTYIGTPAIAFFINRFVAQSMAKMYAQYKESKQYMDKLQNIEKKKIDCGNDLKLIAPIAKRKVALEFQSGGLLVIGAWYGQIENNFNDKVQVSLQRMARLRRKFAWEELSYYIFNMIYPQNSKKQDVPMQDQEIYNELSKYNGNSNKSNTDLQDVQQGKQINNNNNKQKYEGNQNPDNHSTSTQNISTQNIQQQQSPNNNKIKKQQNQNVAGDSWLNKINVLRPVKNYMVKTFYSIYNQSQVYGSNINSATQEQVDLQTLTTLNVSLTIQFMIQNNSLYLYQNIPKSNLIGFCDLSPTEEKSLYIIYIYHGKFYECTVANLDALELPTQGKYIDDKFDSTMYNFISTIFAPDISIEEGYDSNKKGGYNQNINSKHEVLQN